MNIIFSGLDIMHLQRTQGSLTFAPEPPAQNKWTSCESRWPVSLLGLRQTRNDFTRNEPPTKLVDFTFWLKWAADLSIELLNYHNFAELR
jgi:hypothetical protein